MKILMSAFSCGPRQGSEPGVGWNVALEAARMGHEVTVLTQTEFKAEIERELASGTLPANLRFDIFTPGWLEKLRDMGLRCGLPSLTWQTVSLIWQFCALFHARRHYNRAAFDLVHHVTFAGIRHPTLLTRLGIPTVIGPLGGGDRVPMALRKSFPWREWWTELVRDAYNVSLRIDPITYSAFRRASLIVLRTDASLVAVPRRYRNKVHIKGGLGIAEATNPIVRRRSAGQPLRLLYAGNLFHLKGVHLGIRALAAARARGADVTLTIVGDGPARSGLEELAHDARRFSACHLVQCRVAPAAARNVCRLPRVPLSELTGRLWHSHPGGLGRTACRSSAWRWEVLENSWTTAAAASFRRRTTARKNASPVSARRSKRSQPTRICVSRSVTARSGAIASCRGRRSFATSTRPSKNGCTIAAPSPALPTPHYSYGRHVS